MSGETPSRVAIHARRKPENDIARSTFLKKNQKVGEGEPALPGARMRAANFCGIEALSAININQPNTTDPLDRAGLF